MGLDFVLGFLRVMGRDLHEECKHGLVSGGIASSIKDGQENQTDTASHGEKDCH